MPSFLLEVGTEELPASFVSSAMKQWEQRIPKSLDENSLACESVKIYGTPRRLAVLITGLPARQPDREEEIKGPPAKSAFNADGAPTPAAVGFAKKQGVEISAFEVRPTDKGDFILLKKVFLGARLQKYLPSLFRNGFLVWKVSG